jgi:hypothetical protein
MARWGAAEFRAAVADAQRSDDPDAPPMNGGAPSPNTVLWLLLGTAIALGLVGLIDDTGGFAGNLLGEGAGLGVAVFASVMLIERVLRRQREHEWQRVRERLVTATCRHLVEVGTEFHLAATVPLDPARDFLAAVAAADSATPRVEVADGLEAVCDRVRESEKDLRRAQDSDLSSSRSLQQAVVPHLQPIRELITARVIAVTEAPDLVDTLLELEEAERDWRQWLHEVEHWGAPEAIAWDRAVQTMRAVTRAYRTLLEA